MDDRFDPWSVPGHFSLIVTVDPRPGNVLLIGIPNELECGSVPNVMAALPNAGGAFCSTPQSLADAHD